jgi:hypothetical protein
MSTDEPVDYFDVYRTDPEAVFEVDAVTAGQPPLTISIAALGGGTVGRAYANNGWVYAVHLDGDLVASSADLHSGGVAKTHRHVAAVLAACLVGGATVPELAGQSDRLSLWAHDIEEDR